MAEQYVVEELVLNCQMEKVVVEEDIEVLRRVLGADLSTQMTAATSVETGGTTHETVTDTDAVAAADVGMSTFYFF